MDNFDSFMTKRAPTARRPLLGVTVLVVEDSRYACEAFRLMCLKSGARIRRADCLRAAQKHLKVCQPTVVIVDLGLPDGNGDGLIRDLAQAHPRVQVILGTSGDIDGKPRALSAGADGFFHKPIENLSVFQSQILQHLPKEHQPMAPRAVVDDKVEPDAIALQDDLSHVQDLLCRNMTPADVTYVTQFTRGIAKSSDDRPLEFAVDTLARRNAERRNVEADIVLLRNLVADRLTIHIAI